MTKERGWSMPSRNDEWMGDGHAYGFSGLTGPSCMPPSIITWAPVM
jgi:hypothetical protein